MSELNKKLENYRDKNKDYDNYKYIRPVLNQLLVHGFNNEKVPNELPNEFIIDMVHFNEANFEALMLDIGYKVDLTVKRGCFYTHSYTYEVKLI